jgi:TRAP-type mannitol/chloroaromatic compound transport system permease small subunit
MIKAIEKLSERVGIFAGCLALLMTVVISRETIGRYLFKSPTDWALTLSELLLVTMAYLGSAYTLLAEGHVKVDIFYSRLRDKKKAIADMIISAMSFFYVAFLTWQGWKLAINSLKKGLKTSEAVQWPIFPAQLMIPIGSALLALLLIFRFYEAISLIKGRKKKMEP